jgi:hypothetical protein
MQQINHMSSIVFDYWQTLPALIQTILAIVATVLAFYIARFVVIRRLEKLTALTDNDFDDRLVHFLKQFL